MQIGSLLGLMVLVGGNALYAEDQSQKPNFVILLADDISADSIGCYNVRLE